MREQKRSKEREQKMELIVKKLKKDKKMPDIRPGDIVRVYQKIKEGNKEREQAFEGVVIKRQSGSSPAASFVVRRISQGIGVEKKFLIYSPLLTKVQIKKRSSVKRANLSYLRNAKQIARKLKDRKIDPFEESLLPEEEEKEAMEQQEAQKEKPTKESNEKEPNPDKKSDGEKKVNPEKDPKSAEIVKESTKKANK